MKHIRIHHLQHVPFEGLGMFKDWIREKNIQHTSTQLYKNEPLPAIDDFDILLVFGGPMSVHDEVDFFWLKKEKEFILKAIQSNKKVIGICLGAQLIRLFYIAKANKCGTSYFQFSASNPRFISRKNGISLAWRNL